MCMTDSINLDGKSKQNDRLETQSFVRIKLTRLKIRTQIENSPHFTWTD